MLKLIFKNLVAPIFTNSFENFFIFSLQLAYVFNVFIYLGHRSESRYTNKCFRERYR